MPRRRVLGWSFAMTSRLFFQSRGPVEDDGNGRGLSLDVQCRDRRRLDPSMRIVPGTDCAALRYTTKSPRPAPGAHARAAGSAYRLAWRLAPPLAPAAWLPRTSPEETSLTQSEPLPL